MQYQIGSETHSCESFEVVQEPVIRLTSGPNSGKIFSISDIHMDDTDPGLLHYVLEDNGVNLEKEAGEVIVRILYEASQAR